jgi:hypothetical protein
MAAKNRPALTNDYLNVLIFLMRQLRIAIELHFGMKCKQTNISSLPGRIPAAIGIRIQNFYSRYIHRLGQRKCTCIMPTIV